MVMVLELYNILRVILGLNTPFSHKSPHGSTENHQVSIIGLKFYCKGHGRLSSKNCLLDSYAPAGDLNILQIVLFHPHLSFVSPNHAVRSDIIVSTKGSYGSLH